MDFVGLLIALTLLTQGKASLVAALRGCQVFTARQAADALANAGQTQLAAWASNHGAAALRALAMSPAERRAAAKAERKATRRAQRVGEQTRLRAARAELLAARFIGHASHAIDGAARRLAATAWFQPHTEYGCHRRMRQLRAQTVRLLTLAAGWRACPELPVMGLIVRTAAANLRLARATRMAADNGAAYRAAKVAEAADRAVLAELLDLRRYWPRAAEGWMYSDSPAAPCGEPQAVEVLPAYCRGLRRPDKRYPTGFISQMKQLWLPGIKPRGPMAPTATATVLVAHDWAWLAACYPEMVPGLPMHHEPTSWPQGLPDGPLGPTYTLGLPQYFGGTRGSLGPQEPSLPTAGELRAVEWGLRKLLTMAPLVSVQDEDGDWSLQPGSLMHEVRNALDAIIRVHGGKCLTCHGKPKAQPDGKCPVCNKVGTWPGMTRLPDRWRCLDRALADGLLVLRRDGAAALETGRDQRRYLELVVAPVLPGGGPIQVVEMPPQVRLLRAGWTHLDQSEGICRLRRCGTAARWAGPEGGRPYCESHALRRMG